VVGGGCCAGCARRRANCRMRLESSLECWRKGLRVSRGASGDCVLVESIRICIGWTHRESVTAQPNAVPRHTMVLVLLDEQSRCCVRVFAARCGCSRSTDELTRHVEVVQLMIAVEGDLLSCKGRAGRHNCPVRRARAAIATSCYPFAVTYSLLQEVKSGLSLLPF